MNGAAIQNHSQEHILQHKTPIINENENKESGNAAKDSLYVDVQNEGQITSSNTTPVSRRTRHRRKGQKTKSPTVIVRNVSMITYKQAIEELRLEIVSLKEDLNDTNAKLTSLAEDAYAAARNDLKFHIKKVTEEQDVKIEKQEDKMEKIAKQLQDASKENQTLKTRIGTLLSEIKHSKKPLKHEVGVQTDSVCQVSKDVYTQTDETQDHWDLHIMSTPAKINKDDTSLEKKGSETSPVIIIDNSLGSDGSKTDDRNSKEDEKERKSNITTYNRYSALEDDVPTLGSKDVTAQNLGVEKHKENGTYIQIQSQEDSKAQLSLPKSTPCERLLECEIPDKASVALVGDSTIKLINPNRLAPKTELLAKVCVPGITIEHVNTWLYRLRLNSNVKTVILHVGINTCRTSVIAMDSWKDTILLAQRAFPNAKVVMSSVIPARGKHHMNNSIFPSNKNLEETCSKLKASFIDNCDAFLNSSGTPRLIRYHDLIHPSEKGASALARNLKTLWFKERDLRNLGNNLVENHYSRTSTVPRINLSSSKEFPPLQPSPQKETFLKNPKHWRPNDALNDDHYGSRNTPPHQNYQQQIYPWKPIPDVSQSAFPNRETRQNDHNGYHYPGGANTYGNHFKEQYVTADPQSGNSTYHRELQTGFLARNTQYDEFNNVPHYEHEPRAFHSSYQIDQMHGSNSLAPDRTRQKLPTYDASPGTFSEAKS